jgi:hypothetical protein
MGPAIVTEQNKSIAVLIAEMRGEMNTALVGMKGAVARIEDRQMESRDAADHRHRNATMALQHLSDKVDKCVTHDEYDDLKDRVKGIETTHKKITTAALVGAAGGGGILYAFGKKLGIVS